MFTFHFSHISAEKKHDFQKLKSFHDAETRCNPVSSSRAEWSKINRTKTTNVKVGSHFVSKCTKWFLPQSIVVDQRKKFSNYPLGKTAAKNTRKISHTRFFFGDSRQSFKTAFRSCDLRAPVFLSVARGTVSRRNRF